MSSINGSITEKLLNNKLKIHMDDLGNCGLTIAEFRLLCKAAQQVWAAAISTLEFEGSFVQVLEIAKKKPQCRAVLSEIFTEFLQSFDASLLDLTAFCMYELRWQEVFGAAQKIYAKSMRFEEQHAMNGVLNAFEDDWEDKDMYPYFDRQ